MGFPPILNPFHLVGSPEIRPILADPFMLALLLAGGAAFRLFTEVLVMPVSGMRTEPSPATATFSEF